MTSLKHVAALLSFAFLGQAAHADEVSRYLAMPSDPWLPNFCDESLVSGTMVTTAEDGAWSDPATWTPRLPIDGDTVVIEHHVTLDGAASIRDACVYRGGVLEFDGKARTLLEVDTLQVHPDGTLLVGTPETPIEAAAEIVFRDSAIDPDRDPGQYGMGLVALGNVVMHGQAPVKPFVRLGREPRRGDRVLHLAEPVPAGWTVGSRLFLPDTRQHRALEDMQLRSQGEEITAAGFDGNRVTLTAALSHDHLGARDAAGHLELLPHAAHLQRNVTLRSENPAGTRGHVLFGGRASVDIHGVWFRDLGRTTKDLFDNTSFDENGIATKIGRNQNARYALHAHHLIGPENAEDEGYQFKFENNVVEASRKWAVVVHSSHYGLIKGNIAYGFSGAGFVTEDGSESYNRFDGNMAIGMMAGEDARFRIVRSGYRRGVMDEPRRGGVLMDQHVGLFATVAKPATSDFGFAGSGFWATLPHNHFVNNVVANVKFAGFNFNSYLAGSEYRRASGWHIPHARGEVPSIRSVALPLLTFENNEVYGSAHGIWTSNYDYDIPGHLDEEGVFGPSWIWHTSHSAIQSYHNNGLNFDRIVVRGDFAVAAQNEQELARGFDFNAKPTYENGNLRLRNVDVQGMNIGIDLPSFPEDGDLDEPNIILLDSAILGNVINIVENPSLLNPSDEKITIIRNTRFIPIEALILRDEEIVNIWARFDSNDQEHYLRHAASPSKTYVIGYNGDPERNFQVYFPEQNPAAELPNLACERTSFDYLLQYLDRPERQYSAATYFVRTHLLRFSRWRGGGSRLLFGSDNEWRDEITNAECMEREGRAIAGDIAPCVDLECSNRLPYPEIVGLPFPLDRNAPPILAAVAAH